ncbi:response regulator [Azospirillum picis]|uniref:Two-component system chemotaxis response regulator CheY n=1 Tax=Azospirillum picis TaxID=488438 RepID=A0ABU0MJS7_9PROT|nr:response regulator [Azospirillum picis]MBP2300055.1 two-component system chemotaxis response regulator CheY [Azospirillum picis]MDQ0533707.1 two-component system chemotaxis response regulator CheY [Azospirillum picis]
MESAGIGQGMVQGQGQGMGMGQEAVVFGVLSVLVVEDDPFTRMVLAKMLGGLGVGTVIQAADGETALAAVADRTPDVILCDVEMQPLDGFGFVRALRAGTPSGRDRPPVVFMSGRVDQERRDSAGAVGVDALLAKPVAPAALRGVLAACLKAESVVAPH